MRQIKHFLPALFVFLFALQIRSQTESAEFLIRQLHEAKHDTSRAFALLALGEYVYIADPDSSKILYERAQAICKKNLNTNLSPILKRSFSNHLATSYLDLGCILQDKGLMPDALAQFFECLKIKEQIGEKEGAANANICIGSTYDVMDDKNKALDYYFKGLRLFEESNDKSGVAVACNNIGTIYHKLKDTANAFRYFKKTVKLTEEIGDTVGMAYSYISLGSAYGQRHDLTTALHYVNKGLQLHRALGNQYAEVFALNNLGSIYCKMKDFAEAEKYYQLSLKISKELGYPEHIKDAALELSQLYRSRNNGMKALEMYELHIQMRDTINTKEAKKAGIQKQIQYEYDKKASADSIRNAEKEIQTSIKHEEAIKQQRIYTFGGIIGFILMLVIAGISFVAFRNKQKANEVITGQKKLVEEQKFMIEEKQKEIIDSITYAQRIQRSLLPQEKYIHKNISRLKSKK